MAKKKKVIQEKDTVVDVIGEGNVVEKPKKSTLDIAMGAVNKKYGPVLKWLSETPKENIEFIPTGSISLDYALGGGFPRGRIVEIFGWESSGKSTLAMSVAAEANALGLKCLYIDAERALDPRLPIAYGVDPTRFILEDQPFTAEKHFSIIHDVVSSGDIGVCVVDSVSSLVPQAVMDGEIGANHVGQLARFLSQECTMLIHLLGETNTLFIFINQYREKIMKMGGDPRTTSGGNAIKFYSSQRIDVSGSGKTKTGSITSDTGEVIGHRMRFKVLKNKVCIPYRTGEIDLIYGKGYDLTAELIDLATDLGIVSMKGSWYSYKENCNVQGKVGFKNLLEERKELRSSIRKEVLDILKLKS